MSIDLARSRVDCNPLDSDYGEKFHSDNTIAIFGEHTTAYMEYYRYAKLDEKVTLSFEL